MTRAAGGDLAGVGTTCPGWRAWRTRDGALAARKGGSPPAGPHARGGTQAGLSAAIQTAITTGLPAALRPAEDAALGALTAAPGPLPVRAVSGASGLHIATAARVLAALHARGLVTRRRRGRGYRYAPAAPQAVAATELPGRD